MGYTTKVQLIKRAKSEQWYVNFPAQLAVIRRIRPITNRTLFL
jgi:hypothetical protein